MTIARFRATVSFFSQKLLSFEVYKLLKLVCYNTIKRWISGLKLSL